MPKTQTNKPKDKLEIDVYNTSGAVVGKKTLPEEIFGADVNVALLAQASRVFLVNQRSGTRFTKSRGDVHGTTHKMYKQKGTGRARHGTKKAPIFVGGGVAHGPKQMDYEMSLPKSMRRHALIAALSDKYKNGHVRLVQGVDSIPGKTKFLAGMLQRLHLHEAKKSLPATLLVLSTDNRNVVLSGRNIPALSIEAVGRLNTHSVIKSNRLLMDEQAVDKLKFLYTKDAPQKVTIRKSIKKQS